MTKKEARAECRELAIKHGVCRWSLCYDKQNGWYPAPTDYPRSNYHVIYVNRDGAYC